MNDNRTILVIDDEKNVCESLSGYLALDGYQCRLASSGEEGLAFLENEVFDAVILDLRMPGMDGLAVLSRIRETGPFLPVVMMSAHGEIADAVAAMKLGAADYLVKPFDPAELELRVSRVINEWRLLKKARIPEHGSDTVRLGEDKAMKGVIDIISRVAPTNSTVLITGESGTGKEVAAREIHRQSARAAAPFIPVNVGAVPENLLESELFGHEKGAFTGADSKKTGLFELASGGTLFLDELGEMPLLMQVKLLRVIQDKTIVRLGGTRPIPIDVRIIGATNRDLEAAVKTGSFREDLYFRLNVIRIRLPPLRERPADIPVLTGRFLERFSRETGHSVSGITAEALKALMDYSFPGNIRELENIIERAVILASGSELRAVDLMLESPRSVNGISEPEPRDEAVSIQDAEHNAILSALRRNGWHREKTAAELGITRRTLLTKIKQFGLEED